MNEEEIVDIYIMIHVLLTYEVELSAKTLFYNFIWFSLTISKLCTSNYKTLGKRKKATKIRWLA